MSMQCVNCGDALGDEAKSLPVTVAEDGGEGGGKVEYWCAQCFVGHRAQMEPLRFRPGSFRAIHCARCGVTSLDPGPRKCLQCGSPGALTLPPRGLANLKD